MRIFIKIICISTLILTQGIQANAQSEKRVLFGAALFLNTTISEFKPTADFGGAGVDFYANSYSKAVSSYSAHFDINVCPNNRFFYKTGLRLKNYRMRFEPEDFDTTIPNVSSVLGNISRFDLVLPLQVARNLSKRTYIFLGPSFTYHFYKRSKSILFDGQGKEISSIISDELNFSSRNFNLYAEGGFTITYLSREKFSLFVQPAVSFGLFPLHDPNSMKVVKTYLSHVGASFGILFN